MGSVNTEERLSQHFDGELSAEEGEELSETLTEDAALRAKLEGLAHLRTLISAAAEERGDEVDSETLWAGIEAGLESDIVDDDPMLPAAAPAARPPLEVLAGGKKAEPESKPAKRNNVVWIGVATVLAIAAAILLWVMRPGGAGLPGVSHPAHPVAAITPAPEPGSEVTEVDFGYSTGAVFSVEGQEGEHYAVVWISDEKAPLEEDGDERLQ